jgi:phosphate starvation-inducible PhoH-like protein
MVKKNGKRKAKEKPEPIATRITKFKPKSHEQTEARKIIKNNQISFLLGPAGTGKTYLAVSYALEQFSQKKYKKIIITRPIVEAGEKLGSLPGGFEEKTHPYMVPMFNFLEKIATKRGFIDKNIEENTIEILPFAYMRGITFEDTIVIADEMQNASKKQLMMLLTRIGPNAKILVTADPEQSDLNRSNKIVEIAKSLSNIDEIDNFIFTESVRHPIIGEIISVFQNFIE